MSQFQYDLDGGKHREDVVVAGGSAIGTSLVRILVDTANITLGSGSINSDPAKKSEVLRCIDQLRQRIVKETW